MHVYECTRSFNFYICNYSFIYFLPCNIFTLNVQLKAIYFFINFVLMVPVAACLYLCCKCDDHLFINAVVYTIISTFIATLFFFLNIYFTVAVPLYEWTFGHGQAKFYISQLQQIEQEARVFVHLFLSFFLPFFCTMRSYFILCTEVKWKPITDVDNFKDNRFCFFLLYTRFI